MIKELTGEVKEKAEAYIDRAKGTARIYVEKGKAVSETYDKAKSYSTENPGTAILIAVGVGIGLGFLLSAGSRHSRGGRFARPVVNALSDYSGAFPLNRYAAGKSSVKKKEDHHA